MGKHIHGEMKTEVQEQTFEGFVKTAGWAIVVILVILVFTALVNG